MKKRLLRMISVLSIISMLAVQIPLFTVSATDTETASEWLTAEEAGVLSPDKYAYSMAVVPDVQCMNWQDTVGGTKYMYNLYTYLADNADDMKIQYVLGLGDITDNNNVAEWEYAAESVKQLDGVVGYSLPEGNHDNYELNGGKGVIDGMNTYFGADSTYANQYFAYYDNNVRNTAHAFKAGNQKWLVFALEVVPSKSVRTWATGLMQEMSDYNVIITTHQWLSNDGTYFESGDTNPNTVTQTLYEGLVENNSNVKMVLCGHVTPANGSIITATSVNGAEETVYEFLLDAQKKDYNATTGYVPHGMVAFYYFDDNGDIIDLQYYSTAKDMYMNLDADGVSRTYELNAISSDVDDIPEAIGQDTSLTIANRPYTFTAYSGDTLPNWQNAGVSTKLVDGVSPDGSAVAITEISYDESGAYAQYELKFDQKPTSAEGIEGICFWLKTGTRKRSIYFAGYTLNSDYVIRFVKKDGTIATYAGDTNGTRLYMPTSFEGWVYISFDNFATSIDPTTLSSLQFCTDQGSYATTATYYIDNLGYYYGSSDEELTYLTDFTGVTSSDVTVTNATASLTSGISDQGTELQATVTASAVGELTVPVTNSEFTLPQSGYLSFWVKNNGYANYYNFAANSGETTYSALNTAETALLLNDDTNVSTAAITENGITIPAFFEGWVLVPYAAFDTSPAGIVAESFSLTFTRNSSYTNKTYFVIDSISYAENIDDLKGIVGFENSFVPLLDAEGRASEIIDSKYTTNATVSLENEVSPYGRAVKVVTPTTSGKYPQIYLNGNSAKAYNSDEVEGFAFWAKSVDSEYEATLGLYVNGDYLFVAGGSYYLLPEAGSVTSKTISSAKKIEIPAGFEGWVVIPKESCSFTVTSISQINIAAWDPAYQLGCTFYFDSFGYYTNERLMVDARAMENFTVVSNNTYNWKADNFSYSYVDGVSPDGEHAIKITADTAASWKGFEVKADNSVLKTVDGYGGLAMWIKNEGTSAANVFLYQYNSLVSLEQISATYYLISSNGVITTKSGKEPSIPAGFEGWLVLPKNKFRKYGMWDSSIITTFYMSMKMAAGQTIYVDGIGYYRDLEQFKADVTKPKLGDVNADYSINTDDMVSLRKYLLDIDETASAQYPDVNIDTYIDICDLVTLGAAVATETE